MAGRNQITHVRGHSISATNLSYAGEKENAVKNWIKNAREQKEFKNRKYFSLLNTRVEKEDLLMNEGDDLTVIKIPAPIAKRSSYGRMPPNTPNTRLDSKTPQGLQKVIVYDQSRKGHTVYEFQPYVEKYETSRKRRPDLRRDAKHKTVGRSTSSAGDLRLHSIEEKVRSHPLPQRLPKEDQQQSLTKNSFFTGDYSRGYIHGDDDKCISQPWRSARRPDSTSSMQSSHEYGQKSTSNRIMNYVTIDDAFQRHRHSPLAANSAPPFAYGSSQPPRTASSEVPQRTASSEVRRSNTAASQLPATPTVASTPGLQRSASQGNKFTRSGDKRLLNRPMSNSDSIQSPQSTSTTEPVVQNVVLEKAFTDLIDTKVPTYSHNYACQGLFDKSCRRMTKESPPSRKFLRLNKRLKDAVEAFVNDSPMHRHCQERLSGSDINIPETDASCVGTDLAGNNPGSQSNSARAEKRESFLMMIMDMDEPIQEELV